MIKADWLVFISTPGNQYIAPSKKGSIFKTGTNYLLVQVIFTCVLFGIVCGWVVLVGLLFWGNAVQVLHVGMHHRGGIIAAGFSLS